MTKIGSFFVGLSILMIACNASETPIADPPVQFTPVLTLTSVPTVEPSAQATATPVMVVQPPSSNQPVPILFDINGTYKDIVDSVPAGSSKTYSINASKGQITSISIFPQLPDDDWGYLHLKIVGADETVLCPQAPDTECSFWRGVLPSSQNYFVTVTPQGNAVNFILRVAINPPGKNTQSFQYNNPSTGLSLTYSDIFVPAVGLPTNYKGRLELVLQLIDGEILYKTNLSEAYLLISSSSDPAVVNGCTEPNQVGWELEQVIGNEVVNGYTFVHSSTEGAGAGNLYQQEIYRMLNKDICYEVIYFLHSSNVGNFPAEAGITEVDSNAVIQKFYSIFSTFTIK